MCEMDNKCFLFVEYFECYAMKKKAQFDAKVKIKMIKKNNLVLQYMNKLDTCFDKNFMPRCKGPFVVQKVDLMEYF